MDVTFVASPAGSDFRGEVVDLGTQECLMRTGFYASAETAVSAAASMWRASMAKREVAREDARELICAMGRSCEHRLREANWCASAGRMEDAAMWQDAAAGASREAFDVAGAAV